MLLSLLTLFIFIVMLFSYLTEVNGTYNSNFTTVIHNISSSNTTKLTEDNTLMYTNLDLGIILPYFSNWNITYESPYEVEFSILAKEDKTITKTPNFFTPIFDIFVSPLVNKNDSLENVINTITNSYINNPSVYSNFTLLDSNHTDWVIRENQPFYMLNYSYIDYYSNNIINNTEVITIYDGKIYSILYSAEEPNYLEHLLEIKKIIDSFQIFELVPYENFDEGVRIQYPSDWEKVATKDGSAKRFAEFYAPYESESDLYQERIWLSSTELPEGNTTLNDYLEYLTNIYNEDSDTFQVNVIGIESKNLTLSSYPAYRIDYNFTVDGSKYLIATEFGTIFNGKAYYITYIAENFESYLSFLPIAKKIIDSFKLFTLDFFEDVQNNFQIFYPSTWTKKKIDNGIKFYTSENLSPKDNLTIISYNSKDSIKSINDTKWKIYKNLMNFKVIKQINSTVHSTLNKVQNEYQLIYRYNDERNIDKIAIDIIIKHKHRVYYITFDTPENRYQSSIPQTVNDTINHFKFLEFPFYNYTHYSNPSQGIFLKHPFPWKVISHHNTGINITNTSDENLPWFWFSMSTTAAGLSSLHDTVSAHINLYKIDPNVTDFTLVESNETTLSNNSAHRLIYTFKYINDNSVYKSEVIFSKIGIKNYVVEYVTTEDKFITLHQTIKTIFDSLKINEAEYKTDKMGIPVNGSPVDLAINTATDKIYVAVPDMRMVQVLDGKNDNIITNITIGAYPNAIAVNSITNKIYVASPETDKLYIIDGITNRIIKEIPAGTLLGDVAIDTNEFGGYSTLVFVANQGAKQISVIDDVKGKIVGNISTSISPYGIGIDPVKNKAYVTAGNNSVNVIDYSTNDIGRSFNGTSLEKIQDDPNYRFTYPIGIVVDPSSSRAYVTNSDTNNISVIDTNSDRVIDTILVGLFPNSIAFNNSEKKLYVANTGESTVSIVNVSSIHMNDKTFEKNNISIPIKVDSVPFDIAVNPSTNITYLANYESKTISIINGSTRTTAAVFHLDPSDAGKIICNGKDIIQNVYTKIAVGIECTLIANYGFAYNPTYDSISENSLNYTLGFNSVYHFVDILKNLFSTNIDNKNSSKFVIDHYGTYTKHFLSLPIIIKSSSIYLSIITLTTVILIAIVKPLFSKLKLTKKSKNSNIKELGDMKSNKDEEKVSKAEIIGFDVAVIAGILIFLTISEEFETDEQMQISIITATIVFPFAISAVFATMEQKGLATRLMVAGFINLMIAVLLLAIMKLYQ